MPSVQTFKLATWNLQKGPALQNLAKQNIFAAAALSARYQILDFLQKNCDIVFVQEPPTEIRDETQKIDFSGTFETHEKVWLSYNREADNQVHQSANRPAYWTSLPTQVLTTPSNCPCNGNEDAYRLSAMGWTVTKLGEAIFISLHATSGYNAKRNTEDFLKWLAEWVVAEHKGVRFVVIGADFNHWCTQDLQFGAVTATFRQPTAMTQQSGSILDGFCCLLIDPTLKVKWSNAQRVVKGDLLGPIGTRMVQVNPDIQQMENHRGYIGELPKGQLPGTNQMLNEALDIRMSDHCAVVAQLEVTEP